MAEDINYWGSTPQSIFMDWPVIDEDSSDVRKYTILATSSAVGNEFNDELELIKFKKKFLSLNAGE